jgi:hypothetical protein
LDDNDIVIPSKIVSRHHARLERAGEGYLIIIHPDATNRLLFEGKPIAERHRLHDGDEISVDSSVPDQSVKLYYRANEVTAAPAVAPRVVEMKAQPSDKTMLDADFNLEELSTPAELVVTVAGAPAQTYTLNREKLTLGRAEDNDITLFDDAGEHPLGHGPKLELARKLVAHIAGMLAGEKRTRAKA